MSAPSPVAASVTVDISGLERRFGPDALLRAQGLFADRVGFDSNYYVKMDSGDTHDSMVPASDFEKGLVVWDTEYAGYAYRDPHVRTEENPNAKPKWFEVAKEARKESWRVYALAALVGRG
ncbi:hypothetical protein IM763_04905 [Atopobiaceae bacterium FL090493]|jgi:hypothetical protein|nr:hypothetical protein [Atopobiaceae bacterium FL090493]